jgi:hypothetical protein
MRARGGVDFFRGKSTYFYCVQLFDCYFQNGGFFSSFDENVFRGGLSIFSVSKPPSASFFSVVIMKNEVVRMGTTVMHKKYCIQSEMMVKIHIYFRVAFIFFSVIGFDFFPLSFFFNLDHSCLQQLFFLPFKSRSKSCLFVACFICFF